MAAYSDEMGGWFTRPRPIDIRYVSDPPRVIREKDGPHEARSQVWMRADGKLPDDPLLHVCAVAFASRHDAARLDAACATGWRWARTR